MWISFCIIDVKGGEDNLPETRLFDCFGNQLNECLNQIQDGGNKDENLKRFFFVIAFLLFRHTLVPPLFILCIYYTPKDV